MNEVFREMEYKSECMRGGHSKADHYVLYAQSLWNIKR